MKNKCTTRNRKLKQKHIFLIKVNYTWEYEKIKIKRGVSQINVLSPKIFTLALEDGFKKLVRQKFRNNIDDGSQHIGQNMNYRKTNIDCKSKKLKLIIMKLKITLTQNYI